MNSNEKLLEFYKECQKHGIETIDSDYDRHKAFNVAKSLGVDIPEGVIPVFTEAKQLSEEKQSVEDIHVTEQVRNDDLLLAQELSKYSNLYGKEKPLRMIRDEYNSVIADLRKKYEKLKEQAEDEKKLADAMLWLGAHSMEREKSWAVAGGIANGIAGPGAGVAVALDVQRQNADIRARNAQRRSDAVQSSMLFSKSGYKKLSSAEDALKEIERLEKALKEDVEKYELKVIDEKNDEEAFEYVIVDEVKSKIDQAGSVLVTAKLSLKQDCFVYGKKPGYVDGTLTAKIFQDETYIGVADLVLPTDGIKKHKQVTVDGICICGTKSKKKCRIEIIPKNLWILEV